MAEHDANAPVPGAEDGTDIEVIILDGDDAGTAGGEGAAGGDGGAPDPKSGEGEVDYGDLRRQLQEQTAARQDAERRAEVASREAQGAQATAIDGRLGQVTSAIGEWTAHTAKLKRELVEAQQAGDFAKAADLVEKVGEAGAVMRDLNANKAHFEQLKKNPQPQRQPAPQQGQPAADPVETFASTLYPQAAAWVRAHPDFVTDAKKNRMLRGAHEMTIAEHEDGSPEYFAALEARLGIKAGAAAAPTPARRPAPVAAPVSRDAPSLSREAARPRQVTLTASEVAMAKQMGVPLKDYAREKAKVAEEVAAGEHRK